MTSDQDKAVRRFVNKACGFARIGGWEAMSFGFYMGFCAGVAVTFTVLALAVAGVS